MWVELNKNANYNFWNLEMGEIMIEKSKWPILQTGPFCDFYSTGKTISQNGPKLE